MKYRFQATFTVFLSQPNITKIGLLVSNLNTNVIKGPKSLFLSLLMHIPLDKGLF